MKKNLLGIIALLLAMALLAGLTACGAKKEPAAEETSPAE